MSKSPWKKLVPNTLLDQQNASRVHQIKQLLKALGFLKTPVSSVKRAIGLFRKEYTQLDFLKDHKIDLFQEYPGYLDPIELAFLSQLCAFGGELKFEVFPEIGERNLCTRILIYRLNCLGLSNAHPSEALSKNILNKFNKISKWTHSSPDSLFLLNTINNIPKLVALIARSGQLDEQLVTFEFDDVHLHPFLKKETLEEKGEFDHEIENRKIEKRLNKQLNHLEKNSIRNASSPLMNYKSLIVTKQDKIRHKIKEVLKEEKAFLKNQLSIQKGINSNLNNLKRNNDRLILRVVESQKRVQRSVLEMGSHFLHLPEKKKIIGITKQLKSHLLSNTVDLEKALKKLDNYFTQLEKWLPSLLLKKYKKEYADFFKFKIGAQIQIDKTKKRIADQEKELVKEKAFADQKIRKKQLEIQTQVRKLKILEGKVKGLKFKFKAKLKKSLSTPFYKQIKQQVFTEKNQDFLRQNSKEEYNKFLIRLVQLTQWTKGYYNGQLDSKFKIKTFESIADLIEDTPGLRLKYVMAKLKNTGKSYWVLNIAYLLNELSKNYKQDPPQILSSEKILQEIKKKGAGQQLEIALAEHEETSDTNAYRGKKSLLRFIGKGIGRLIQILKRGIEKTIQFFKSFIRLIYDEIRETGQLFFQSMDFIFGKRTDFPMTDLDPQLAKPFQFDEQKTTAQNAQLALVQLEERLNGLDRSSKSVSSTFKFIKKILSWGIQLATGGITWPKLLLQMTLFFKKLLVNWLRNVLKPGTRKLVLG